jgi:hypothetical protein
MRAVIGPLLARGQHRGDREVAELVIGCGNLADRGEISVELPGQAESGDAPGRFRRELTDGAGRRELARKAGMPEEMTATAALPRS